jgi:hypothetical protein
MLSRSHLVFRRVLVSVRLLPTPMIVRFRVAQELKERVDASFRRCASQKSARGCELCLEICGRVFKKMWIFLDPSWQAAGRLGLGLFGETIADSKQRQLGEPASAVLG